MILNGLILAAGQSARLGQPKQLLKYQGQSLLWLTEDKLLRCCDQVYVVLGYKPELFATELSSSQVIINAQWQQGMGHSLSLGVETASKGANGVLIALVDQPFIPIQHYQHMSNKFRRKPQSIVSSKYQNSFGVPAIFPESMFKHLINLEDNHGAKNLITKHQELNIGLDCEDAAIDIDLNRHLSILRDNSDH